MKNTEEATEEAKASLKNQEPSLEEIKDFKKKPGVLDFIAYGIAIVSLVGLYIIIFRPELLTALTE